MSIWDEVSVDSVGQNSLRPVTVTHQLHETLLKFLREFVHKSVGVLNKELHLSLVTIWHPMALEAILVSALLLTHLAIPSQLLKALGLHFVAEPFCWSHLLLRHCTVLRPLKCTSVQFVTLKWSDYCHSFRSHCAWLTLNRGENLLKWLRTSIPPGTFTGVDRMSLRRFMVICNGVQMPSQKRVHFASHIQLDQPFQHFPTPLERLEPKNATTCGYMVSFTSGTASTDTT